MEATNSSKVAVLAETKPKIFERQFSEQKGASNPNLDSLLPLWDTFRTLDWKQIREEVEVFV